MRPTLTLAIVSVLAAGAAEAAPSVLQTSCRSFVSSYKVERFYSRVAPNVAGFVQERDGFENTLASECNTMELVRAECIAHPKMRVVDALESLMSKDRAKQPMPVTRACGA